MVTAESKTENVIAAKKAGVNNYIVKPFNAQTSAGAWTPEQTVDFMFDSLARGDFYILCPDNDVKRPLDVESLAADRIVVVPPYLCDTCKLLSEDNGPGDD